MGRLRVFLRGRGTPTRCGCGVIAVWVWPQRWRPGWQVLRLTAFSGNGDWRPRPRQMKGSNGKYIDFTTSCFVLRALCLIVRYLDLPHSFVLLSFSWVLARHVVTLRMSLRVASTGGGVRQLSPRSLKQKVVMK